MGKNFEKMRAGLPRLRTRVDMRGLRDSIVGITQLLDEKDEWIDALEARIDALEARIDAAENETKLLKNKVHRLQSRR